MRRNLPLLTLTSPTCPSHRVDISRKIMMMLRPSGVHTGSVPGCQIYPVCSEGLLVHFHWGVHGCGACVADECLAPGWIEAVDLNVNAGRNFSLVLLEDDLVEGKLAFETQPVEQNLHGDCGRIDIDGGVAADAKVEGSCLAADLGVVARIAVAVMNADSSEFVVDGFENLLAEEGHVLDDVRVSTRQNGQPWFGVCEMRCKL